MQLINAGYNWLFNNNCKIDFPKTDAGFRIYVFHTPVKLQIEGEIYSVGENNAILMKRGEAHQIYAESDNEEFMLDWVEFDMLPADIETVAMLEIPYNQVLYLTRGLPISNLIMNLSYLKESCLTVHGFTYYYILVAMIFNIDAVMIRSDQDDITKTRYPEIAQLRFMIREQPQIDWTLERMSEITHFSVSQLQRLYQQIYSVSCMEEVLNCRIKRAEHLLSATLMSITEISEQCGFHSYEHFTRTFKKKTGRSPSEYRKRGQKKYLLS